MKKLYLIPIILLCATAHAEHTYTKEEILALVNEPGTVSYAHPPAPPVVEDVTPKTNCQKGNGNPDGFGHQETSICPDGASGLKDMAVTDGKKKVFWKGNPAIGYYKLRDDGSIDTSHWRSSLEGVLA